MRRDKREARRLLSVLILIVGCQGPPAKAVFAPGLTQQGFGQVRAGMTKPDVEALIGSPLRRHIQGAMTTLIYPGFLEGTQEEVEVWVRFNSEGRLISNYVYAVVSHKAATVPGLADLGPEATMREVEAVLGQPIDRDRRPEVEAWYYSRQGWIWDTEVYVSFGEDGLVTLAGIDFGDVTRYLCDSEDVCPTAGDLKSLGFVPGVLYPRPVLRWWPFSVYGFEGPSPSSN